MGWRIPEPWQLADAHFAELDAARERELASGTCAKCGHYQPAPREWAHIDFGWCARCDEWTEADHPAYECGGDYEAAA